jgi:hypothetical protein
MYNARIADANARASLMDGATASAASDAKYRSAIGEQLAAQGASGFQMGTGSNLDAVLASRVNQTYAAMSIQRPGGGAGGVREPGGNEPLQRAAIAVSGHRGRSIRADEKQDGLRRERAAVRLWQRRRPIRCVWCADAEHMEPDERGALWLICPSRPSRRRSPRLTCR